MAETKNLCAQIPLDLHAKVCEAKERLGITTSQYMTGLLRTYFTIFCTQEKKGVTNMENSRDQAAPGARECPPGAEGDPTGVCPGPDRVGPGSSGGRGSCGPGA